MSVKGGIQFYEMSAEGLDNRHVLSIHGKHPTVLSKY